MREVRRRLDTLRGSRTHSYSRVQQIKAKPEFEAENIGSTPLKILCGFGTQYARNSLMKGEP
jgi:hypothetical protein